jgi:hypothetical protein
VFFAVIAAHSFHTCFSRVLQAAICLVFIALAAGTEARCWQYAAGTPARLHCSAVYYELEAQVL